MNKFSYDATWADLVALARTNASVLAIIAGAFLFLPNFAQLLLAPPPELRSLDWNGVRLMEQYFSSNGLTLILCNLPVWLGSAGILALLLDPRRLTVGESLLSGLRLLPGVIVLNWLTQFLTFMGLLLLVVPGVYLIGRLMLAAPTQMAERIGNPVAAIQRSFALSGQNGWRIAGLVLLIAVVAMIAAAAINLVAGIVLSLVVPKAALAISFAMLKSAIGATTALLLLLLGAALYRQLVPAP